MAVSNGENKRIRGCRRVDVGAGKHHAHAVLRQAQRQLPHGRNRTAKRCSGCRRWATDGAFREVAVAGVVQRAPAVAVFGVDVDADREERGGGRGGICRGKGGGQLKA
jgi:hypothetical protein